MDIHSDFLLINPHRICSNLFKKPRSPKPGSNNSLQINSTRIITDETGNVIYSAAHGPYGDIQKTWVNTYEPKLKFSGKERESYSEYDYFGARYYDHLSFRFISPDPERNKDEVLTNPQLWNLYSYCRNNPVTFFDPDGRVEEEFYEHLTPLRSRTDDSFTRMKTLPESGPVEPEKINGLYYPRYVFKVIAAIYIADKHKGDTEILAHEKDHMEGYRWFYKKTLNC